MVVSPEILEEYIRVGSEFSSQRANFDFERFLALLLSGSLLVEAVPGPSQICADPDDDKFIHCALAAGAPYIISGDRHLLDVSGHGGVQVIRPREFVEEHTGQTE
jgi:putative PIN family toxin of toxin-antitoxin system